MEILLSALRIGDPADPPTDPGDPRAEDPPDEEEEPEDLELPPELDILPPEDDLEDPLREDPVTEAKMLFFFKRNISFSIN